MISVLVTNPQREWLTSEQVNEVDAACCVQEYLKCVPPSIAYFAHDEPDTIVYTGYGLHKYIQLYSITQGKVCLLLVVVQSDSN